MFEIFVIVWGVESDIWWFIEDLKVLVGMVVVDIVFIFIWVVIENGLFKKFVVEKLVVSGGGGRRFVLISLYLGKGMRVSYVLFYFS